MTRRMPFRFPPFLLSDEADLDRPDAGLEENPDPVTRDGSATRVPGPIAPLPPRALPEGLSEAFGRLSRAILRHVTPDWQSAQIHGTVLESHTEIVMEEVGIHGPRDIAPDFDSFREADHALREIQEIMVKRGEPGWTGFTFHLARNGSFRLETKPTGI